MILLLAALPSCIAVSGEHITARDAAQASPAFARLDPGKIIGLSPVPGARRVFGPDEIFRLTGDSGAVPLCFEYEVSPLRPEVLIDGLRRAVVERYPEARDWQIHLIDHDRHPAPSGPLRFASSSFTPNQPRGELLVRGTISYTASRTHPVWVRLRIEAPRRRVFARRRIARGTVIDPSEIEERMSTEPAPPRSPSLTASEVAGMVAINDIPVGAPVELPGLRKPPAVRRGDMVTIEVLNGAARLSFEGRAEANGRAGDRIAVLNPVSGRKFSAVVSGTRRAVVKLDERRFQP